MIVYGPPFYDENEWEPDGPTLMEMLGLIPGQERTLFSPWQMHAIRAAMAEEHGRAWKAPFQAFIDALQPIVEQFNKRGRKMQPVIEIIQKPAPRHGPQWNPHARNGKGARR